MIPDASTRRFWESRASALARQINFAAWVGRMAPAVFFVASAFAGWFYALRRTEAPLTLAWGTFVGVLAATGAIAWWRARGRFYRAEEARVLLEARLRLDTRLTAAHAGLVRWPAAPAKVAGVLRWNLRAPLGWSAAAGAMIAAGLLLPIAGDAKGPRGAGAPPALLQTEAMLEALKTMDVADPKAIEQLEERARELARRPGEEQYSHSALEAADALRNQTAVSAAELARGLDAAAQALRAGENSADMKEAAGQLAAALSGLRDGAMPANKELLANLPASGADLKNLSAEQRAQLAQQLAEAAKGVKGIAGAAGAGANVAEPDPNGTGQGAGAGGPGGGGDSAPLTLANQASDAGDGSAEALNGDALKRFALGDKLGTTAGAHEADPAKAVGPGSAGAVAAPAGGGEAVWVNRLTPAERAALKEFFK